MFITFINLEYEVLFLFKLITKLRKYPQKHNIKITIYKKKDKKKKTQIKLQELYYYYLQVKYPQEPRVLLKSSKFLEKLAGEEE